MIYLFYQITGALLWLIAVDQALKKTDLNRVFGLDLSLLILVSGLLGGRLFYVLYEDFDFYWANPLDVIKIWQGGFVFYGGLITALISVIVLIKKRQQSFWRWADFFSPWLAIGYAFGRVGCALAGCCYGQFCDLPWAIDQKHPTPIYAFVWEILLILFLKSELRRGLKDGRIFLTWLIGHGLGRIFMEHYRGDFRGHWIAGQSIGTWISYGMIIISLAILLFREHSQSISDSKS